VDAPSVALVGTTTEVTVHLRNVTDRTLYVQSRECTDAVAVTLPSDLVVQPMNAPEQWDGSAASLPGWLRKPWNRGASYPGGEFCRGPGTNWPVLDNATETGVYSGNIWAIRPGEVLERTESLDLPWAAGVVPTTTNLVVTTGVIGVADAMPDRTDYLEMTVPFRLTDDPRRLASLDAALAPDGLAAAPTLQDWLTFTAGQAPLQVPGAQAQKWYPALVWHTGRWDLWILPAISFGDPAGHPLRIRWDTDRNQVVDVRTTSSAGRAEDDPRYPALPGSDVIRYHVD
jgi:hypothetical protein